MNDIEKLEVIEQLMVSASANMSELRKRAEGLYDDAVATIMKRDGCDAVMAHYTAANEPIARQAYALMLELQEREIAARDSAHSLAAHMN